MRIGLPLHRGPHRQYNALVLERVGQVEAGWSALRLRAPEIAINEALMRLRLLQAALRRRLLAPAKRLSLNRFDPLGREADFSHMDAMVDALWSDTAIANEVTAKAVPPVQPGASARHRDLSTPAELALIVEVCPRDNAETRPIFGAQLAARGGRSAFAF